MDIAGVDVEIDVIKEYPELEDLVVNPSIEDQNFNSSKYGFKSVKINAIKGEELSLNPTTEQQNVEGVFTKVKVNAIKTQKLNTVPSTQEQVIKGLFDEVTVNAIEGEELNLNPSEEKQNFEGVFLGVNINPIQVEEITTDLDFSSSDTLELAAQEGAYIKKATINKPSNLKPENIKSGENVCGVEGTNADTSDADATSDDIVAGKTAYVDNKKISGTFKPLDTSDATATAEDIAEGKTAYVNGEKVEGTLIVPNCNAVVSTTVPARSTSNAGLMDFITELHGYLKTGTNAKLAFYKCTNLKYIEQLDTSSTTSLQETFSNCTSLTAIPQMDTSNVTSLQATFNRCYAITELPQMNTSKVTTMYQMCYNCSNLVTVPLLDTSSLNGTSTTGMVEAFMYCPNLSDESLNNIMMMCINAKNIKSSLAYLGLTATQIAKCKTLSNYQAFLDAGWTAE